MTHVEVDAGARRAIAEDLDQTLVVEAAAGTGKTTELINRILAVLRRGLAPITKIAAVTFTEKAAGELKLRLRQALEEQRWIAADDSSRGLLDEALAKLEEAHVSTIHGFCADILRERPVEARVDPLFTVLTESQSARLYDRAFRGWLQEALRDPPEGVRRALRRTSMFRMGLDGGSDGPIDRLRKAGRLLADWRDFDREWLRPVFDRPREIERVIASLHHLANLTARASSTRDNLFIDTDGVRRLSRQIRLETSPEGTSPDNDRDLDGWESRLVDLFRERGFSRTRRGSGHKFGPDVARSEVLAARDALYFELQDFKRRADADLAAALQRELKAVTARYEALKASAGALDFTDLLAKARDLIKGNREVRQHLQGKFARLFVDEFQDTDPIQAEILLLLAASNADETDWKAAALQGGKLFIVGDPKQAIYRFRGADVGTYQLVRNRVEESGGRVVKLKTSYRSVPEIQGFVNAAFSEEMIEDERTLQASYVELSPVREGNGAQPAIVALPVPKPYAARGPLKASARAIESSLPDAVGAFVAWLVDPKNGWQVAERQSGTSERWVPLQSRHIAILFRRFVSFDRDVTRAYADALEARGIPHLLVGGRTFHDREEVDTIRVALRAIEWPDDELSVFATLRGSLFAIDDEQLLEYRHRFRAVHPFRIPKALGGNAGGDLELTSEPTGHLTPIADALRLLQSLHRGRNYRPVADTIGRLLVETRAHVGFILRPAGEQVLANVLHLAELARRYEAGGGLSFRGFIDELREAAASEGAEAPILEESSDGVRLMTVHKAKGLEFPVVILADPTCHLSRDDASRYLNAGEGLCAMKIGGWAPQELLDHEAEEAARDRAEGIRLAYVAATRARDLLVIPAVGDEPWDGGWLSPLNRALYPPLESRRTAGRGPKCPAFKSKDSVGQRPNDETAGPQTVCPGAHHFSERGYSVVWWEPGAGGGLVLGVKPSFGVRREELIVKDVPRDVVADGRSSYDRWRLGRIDTRTAGATPSVKVDTVRAWTSDEGRPLPAAAALANVTVLDLEGAGRDKNRSGGAAFGALVHAVFAQAPFEATRQTLDDIAAVEARMLGLDERDAQSAATAVERALRHELFSRARGAMARGACRRETPISLTLADGTVLEGIVDLAFEENGGWTVVDYKTDREIAADGEGRYRRQVALYAMAIAQATGSTASAILARV